MKIAKVLEVLDKIAPFEDAEEWDNCGLLLGDKEAKVKQLYLALEATLEVIENMEADSLLIVHHPLIFKPLKELDFAKYPANILQKAIQKNIAIIAMHTNFDTHVLNPYSAKKAGFGPKTKNICLEFKIKKTKKQLLTMLAENLETQNIKHVNLPDTIASVAFVCGSGKSFLGSIGSDVLITGDVDYHAATTAVSLGKGIIDVGHYELERFFPEALAEQLKKEKLKAIITDSKNPFSYSYFQEK